MALCCRSFWLHPQPLEENNQYNHQDEARPCFPLRRLRRRLLCCEFQSVADVLQRCRIFARGVIGRPTESSNATVRLKMCRYQARYRAQACLVGWNARIWTTSVGGSDCSIHLVLGRRCMHDADGCTTHATCGVWRIRASFSLPIPSPSHLE